jgi:hypothetical protein
MENTGKLKLIVSDDVPKVAASTKKVEVTLVDSQLKQAKPIAARLCGGTSTCIALIETD